MNTTPPAWVLEAASALRDRIESNSPWRPSVDEIAGVIAEHVGDNERALALNIIDQHIANASARLREHGIAATAVVEIRALAIVRGEISGATKQVAIT